MPKWVNSAYRLAKTTPLLGPSEKHKLLPLWPWGQVDPAWKVILISQAYYCKTDADFSPPKVADDLSFSEMLHDIPAANITGQLTSAQIASLDTSKLTGLITGDQIAPNTLKPHHFETLSVGTPSEEFLEIKPIPKIALTEEDAVPGDVLFDQNTGFFYKVFEDGTHGPLDVKNLSAEVAEQAHMDAHEDGLSAEEKFAVDAANALKHAGLGCKALHSHFVADELPEVELVLQCLPKHKGALLTFISLLTNPPK